MNEFPFLFLNLARVAMLSNSFKNASRVSELKWASILMRSQWCTLATWCLSLNLCKSVMFVGDRLRRRWCRWNESWRRRWLKWVKTFCPSRMTWSVSHESSSFSLSFQCILPVWQKTDTICDYPHLVGNKLWSLPSRKKPSTVCFCFWKVTILF